jgi:phosphoribosyl 1,2-cyclic phosphodiesterase
MADQMTETSPEHRLTVCFWGTRGSIPTPGRDTIDVGGDTPCVEICTAEEEIIVLDAGTGLRRLGLALESRSNLHIHLFLSHTHWDHIQGFPFFRPLYNSRNQVTLYGPKGVERGLEETLKGQMQVTYYPVQLADLKAGIRFVELHEESLRVNSHTRVTSREFQHPGGVLAYRIERNGKSVVYGTDVETDDEDKARQMIEFSRSADLLIMDCQFNGHEYESSRRGWGHSTPEMAAHVAREAGVRWLALFHHDPTHNDPFLWELERHARSLFRATFLAKDGMTLLI